MAGISVSAGSPPFYREISLGHDKKVRNGSRKGCRFCCLLGQLFITVYCWRARSPSSAHL